MGTYMGDTQAQMLNNLQTGTPGSSWRPSYNVQWDPAVNQWLVRWTANPLPRRVGSASCTTHPAISSRHGHDMCDASTFSHDYSALCNLCHAYISLNSLPPTWLKYLNNYIIGYMASSRVFAAVSSPPCFSPVSWLINFILQASHFWRICGGSD